MSGGRSRRRKMRGGMYGFGGAISTNGPMWTGVANPAVNSTTLQSIGEPIITGGRRRSRRHRARRGGADMGTGSTTPAPNPDEQPPVAQGSEGTLPAAPAASEGGRRRRKSKKAKKSKKTSRRRSRKMRGGAAWQSVAAAGYGFDGSGQRGLANAVGYAAKVPPAGGPTQNPDGAYRP